MCFVLQVLQVHTIPRKSMCAGVRGVDGIHELEPQNSEVGQAGTGAGGS